MKPTPLRTSTLISLLTAALLIVLLLGQVRAQTLAGDQTAASVEDYVRCYLVENILVCELVRKPKKPKKRLPEITGRAAPSIAPGEIYDEMIIGATALPFHRGPARQCWEIHNPRR
jgi:hypothetical protein